MLLNEPSVVVPGHLDTGAKVSAYTVSRIHKVLKSAFGKAVVWEYTAVNPILGATLPEQKSVKRDAWSDEGIAYWANAQKSIHEAEIVDAAVLARKAWELVKNGL